MKLKTKFLSMSLIPLLLLGAITIVLCKGKINEVVSENVQRGLHATALSVRETLRSSSTGQYSVNDQGNLQKGEYNITEHEEIADEIKNATGMEVTVFFGDTRYMTSVTDESGNRVLGTKAGDTVIQNVLVGNKEYFASNVDVVGQPFYAYYIPLYDEGNSEPIGMVFTGLSQANVNAEILKVTGLLIGIFSTITIISIGFLLIAIRGIVNSLSKGEKALEAVVGGNLKEEIPEAMLRRKDEIGQLSRTIEKLRLELSEVIRGIKSDGIQLNETSHYLQDKAAKSSVNVEQVEKAVEEIADGAESQADETQRATENVILMGNMVEETNQEVQDLHENAKIMKSLGQEAFVTLKELDEINQQARTSIDEIYRQTYTTNESAQKIKEATQLITNIAEETNLLSLNASIEAARAGEQGRGFAVVASEIQKLAEQSNASARQIEEIIATLIADSEQAVETMNVVKEVMDKQNQNVKLTDEKFAQVLKGIDSSIEKVNVINDKTQQLDEARTNVVDVVQNLTAIAEENAASTEETSASMTEVGNAFGDIADSASKLKEIANEMEKNMAIFQV